VVAVVAQVLPVAVVVCPAHEQGNAVVDLGSSLDASELQAQAAQRVSAQQAITDALQLSAADSADCHVGGWYRRRLA
jgi:hypothetical protein